MNKKVGVNLEENRLEHSGSEVLEGDGAQEQKTAESGRELTGDCLLYTSDAADEL